MPTALRPDVPQELVERRQRRLLFDLDVSGVGRDHDLLFEADIIEFETDGQRKIPRIKPEIVVSELIA